MKTAKSDFYTVAFSKNSNAKKFRLNQFKNRKLKKKLDNSSFAMDLITSEGEKLTDLFREMFSIACKTAFKKFQIILTSKLNEILFEKTANQQSDEKTWIDKNAKMLG